MPNTPGASSSLSNWNSNLITKGSLAGTYSFSQSERKDIHNQLMHDFQGAWTEQLEYRRRCMKVEDYADGRQVYDTSQARFVGHEVAGAPSATDNVDDEIMIDNKLRRVLLSYVQRLSSYQINPIAIPKTNSPGDKEGARIGRTALLDMFRRMKAKKFKRLTATVLGKYGTVFFETLWDPTLGDLVHPLKRESNPLSKDYGNLVPNMDVLMPQGEVRIQALSPRNGLLPRYCRDLRTADWFEKLHMETTSWVWRATGKAVDPEPIDIRTWMDPASSDTDIRSVEWPLYAPKDSLPVHLRWVRPCANMQRGAIFLYTGRHLLRSTDLLSHLDDIPVTMATAILDEKTAMGESLLWDLIPLQDGINSITSLMLNRTKIMGDLQAQVNTAANFKVKDVDNATGHLYEYQGEKGLEMIQWPDLPRGHYQTRQILDMDLQSLGAAQDIARRPGVLSGNALATLQTMDDTVLRPILEDVGEALETSCMTALKLMDRHYDIPRMVRTTGASGAEIINDFTGKLLEGNYEVDLKLMTGLSNNPSVRQETILKLVGAGMMTAQQGADKLEFGESDKAFEEIQKESEIADVNLKLIIDPNNYVPSLQQPGAYTNLKFQPQSYDNAQAMYDKLTRWMRENQRTAPPQVQQGTLSALQYYIHMLLPPPQPVAQGGGAAPAPRAAPALAPYPQEQFPDSVQNPGDQPAPGSIPSPAFTGLAQAPGGQ